ncbi:MAG: ferrous iron transport protein A [Halanaerobiales bacterium]|nr:ferrous iron transport protein A [Halanaerobiales bacterium]
MTLAEINRGSDFKVKRIPDDMIRVQTLRMGISEGSKLNCNEKIPGGPIIVKRNYQEIAIGRNLAKDIEIEVFTEGSD